MTVVGLLGDEREAIIGVLIRLLSVSVINDSIFSTNSQSDSSTVDALVSRTNLFKIRERLTPSWNLLRNDSIPFSV